MSFHILRPKDVGFAGHTVQELGGGSRHLAMEEPIEYVSQHLTFIPSLEGVYSETGWEAMAGFSPLRIRHCRNCTVALSVNFLALTLFTCSLVYTVFHKGPSIHYIFKERPLNCAILYMSAYKDGGRSLNKISTHVKLISN